MARLAIGVDFLAEYAALEKPVQSAVEAAISKFAEHTHAGLHLEKIAGSKDDRIRTIRIDGFWRGVVLAPDSGDIYCLLASDAHLEALQTMLPEAQYAALYALACGMTVEEAWAQVAQYLPADTPPAEVDPADLVTAMERTPGRVAFVSGPAELQRILADPFAAWRTFLHPSQRAIAYQPAYAGPAQVTGGAGTGKTVTALHRAAFLAERLAGAGASRSAGPWFC